MLLLVEQNSPAILAYRRQDQGFTREAYEGLESVVPLPEIGTSLPLSEVYEAVTFTSENEASDKL